MEGMKMIYENALDIMDFTMSQATLVRHDGDCTVLGFQNIKSPEEDRTTATVTFRDLQIQGYLADDFGSPRLSLAGDDARKRLLDAFVRPVTVFAAYDFTRSDRYYLTSDIGASEGIVTVDLSFSSVTVDFVDAV